MRAALYIHILAGPYGYTVAPARVTIAGGEVLQTAEESRVVDLDEISDTIVANRGDLYIYSPHSPEIPDLAALLSSLSLRYPGEIMVSTAAPWLFRPSPADPTQIQPYRVSVSTPPAPTTVEMISATIREVLGLPGSGAPLIPIEWREAVTLFFIGLALLRGGEKKK